MISTCIGCGTEFSGRRRLHRANGGQLFCSRACRWEHIPTHGHKRGETASPTYETWCAMKKRCSLESHEAYDRYGGRGIKVCDRWLGEHGFENFLADMGERPDGKSIDRFPDRDGNYEPTNCRWATRSEQAINSSVTKLEPHEPAQIRWLNGLGYSYRAVARFFEVSTSTVSMIVTGKTWRAS